MEVKPFNFPSKNICLHKYNKATNEIIKMFSENVLPTASFVEIQGRKIREALIYGQYTMHYCLLLLNGIY